MNGLLGMLSDKSRFSLAMIGCIAFAVGVFLMIRHKRDIDDANRTVQDSRQKRFEQGKFRRRSYASTIIAAMGILMVSLYWAREPAAFTRLVLVVLILLLAALFLGCLDLMSVSLQRVHQDDSARKKMVAEYLRQRKKIADRVEENEGSE